MADANEIVERPPGIGRWSKDCASGWIELSGHLGIFLVAFDLTSHRGRAAFADDVAQIDALLHQLKSEAASGRLPQVKLVGQPALVASAKALCLRLGLTVVASKDLAGGLSRAFFHPYDGQLRFERGLAPGTEKARVLIVDDSKTIRQVLRSILSRDPDIEVVGECENPLDVERSIATLKPNVLSLDINMPEMDGVTLVRLLLAKMSLPIIMVTALSSDQSDQVMQSLAAGAVDYIQKPSLNEIDHAAADICQRFKVASRAKVRVLTPPRTAPRRSLKAIGRRPVILIGSSTGGTEAVSEILGEMPENIPPIVIVQHIPAQFSGAFAKRLAANMPFAVKEAEDGDEVQDGRVLIAPGGRQLELVRVSSGLKVRIYDGPTVSGHRPSVDVMFRSAAQVLGAEAIGVILTGMGKDGSEGLLRLREAGAATVGQNEATCVVYGMPGVAMKIGAVECELPIHEIAQKLADLVDRWAIRRAG